MVSSPRITHNFAAKPLGATWPLGYRSHARKTRTCLRPGWHGQRLESGSTSGKTP